MCQAFLENVYTGNIWKSKTFLCWLKFACMLTYSSIRHPWLILNMFTCSTAASETLMLWGLHSCHKNVNKITVFYAVLSCPLCPTKTKFVRIRIASIIMLVVITVLAQGNHCNPTNFIFPWLNRKGLSQMIFSTYALSLIWAFWVMVKKNRESTLFQLHTVILKKVCHEDYADRCMPLIVTI